MEDRKESPSEKPTERDDCSAVGAQSLLSTCFNVSNDDQTETSKHWIMGRFSNEKEQSEMVISYKAGDPEIEEYRIENPKYRPTNSSKFLGVQVLKFGSEGLVLCSEICLDRTDDINRTFVNK